MSPFPTEILRAERCVVGAAEELEPGGQHRTPGLPFTWHTCGCRQLPESIATESTEAQYFE